MSLAEKLSKMVDETIADETQVKIANVTEAYKNDPVAQQCFADAIEIVKKAEEAGEIEKLDTSNFVSVAAKLADIMRAEEAERGTRVLGDAAGAALAREGFDLSKIAGVTGDEAKQVSEMLVQVGIAELQRQGVDTSAFTPSR